MNDKNALLGLDIGTTNISAVVIDCDSRELMKTYTIANNSRKESEGDFSEYDPEWIAEKAVNIVDKLIDAYPNIKAIGLTGQMHGFVYVSEEGKEITVSLRGAAPRRRRGNLLYHVMQGSSQLTLYFLDIRC